MSGTTKIDSSELCEALAHNAHEQWTRWMAYLLDKLDRDEQGRLVVGLDYELALRAQMETPYARLEPAVQDLDREEARLQMQIVRAVLGG